MKELQNRFYRLPFGQRLALQIIGLHWVFWLLLVLTPLHSDTLMLTELLVFELCVVLTIVLVWPRKRLHSVDKTLIFVLMLAAGFMFKNEALKTYDPPVRRYVSLSEPAYELVQDKGVWIRYRRLIPGVFLQTGRFPSLKKAGAPEDSFAYYEYGDLRDTYSMQQLAGKAPFLSDGRVRINDAK